MSFAHLRRIAFRAALAVVTTTSASARSLLAQASLLLCERQGEPSVGGLAEKKKVKNPLDQKVNGPLAGVWESSGKKCWCVQNNPKIPLI